MATLRAVLFDLGDTLVDLGEGRGSYEARVVARAGRVYDVLAGLGARLPEREPFCTTLAAESEARYQAALRELKGLDIFAFMSAFLREQGLPQDDALVAAAGDAYCRGGGGAPAALRTGALELLAALRGQGLKLGVISNTIQPALYMSDSLVRRGLAPYTDVAVYSSELGVAKPHPAIFRAALDALAVPPPDAVYVGDRLATDVAGARGVGMKTVLIAVDHRVEEDPAVAPDARITELPELLDVLPQLFAR